MARRLWWQRKATIKALAEQYGVSYFTMRDAIHGFHYKELESGRTNDERV